MEWTQSFKTSTKSFDEEESSYAEHGSMHFLFGCIDEMIDIV